MRGGWERGRGAARGSRGGSRSREEPPGAARARTCGGEERPWLPALPARGQCWGERSSGSGCGESGRGAGGAGTQTGVPGFGPGYLDPDRAAASFLPVCPDLRLVSGESCVRFGLSLPGCTFQKAQGCRFNLVRLFTLGCYFVMQVGSWDWETFQLGRNAGELSTGLRQRWRAWWETNPAVLAPWACCDKRCAVIKVLYEVYHLTFRARLSKWESWNPLTLGKWSGGKIQQLPCLAFEENYCWTDRVKVFCCVLCSHMQRMLCLLNRCDCQCVMWPDVLTESLPSLMRCRGTLH